MTDWNVLETKNTLIKYLYRLFQDGKEGGYSLEVTDLTSIYRETLNSDQVERRCQILNPFLEADSVEFVQELKELLRAHHNVYERQNKTENKLDFCVENGDKDEEVPIKWEFNLIKQDESSFKEGITRPIIESLNELLKQRKMLFEVIQSKDKELTSLYEDEQASLTRKSLKTKKFQVSRFLEQFSSKSSSSTSEDLFDVLTSKDFTELSDILKKPQKVEKKKTFKKVEKRKKMTKDQMFLEDEEDEEEKNQTEKSQVPTTPIKTQASKKQALNQKLRKL